MFLISAMVKDNIPSIEIKTVTPCAQPLRKVKVRMKKTSVSQRVPEPEQITQDSPELTVRKAAAVHSTQQRHQQSLTTKKTQMKSQNSPKNGAASRSSVRPSMDGDHIESRRSSTSRYTKSRELVRIKRSINSREHRPSTSLRPVSAWEDNPTRRPSQTAEHFPSGQPSKSKESVPVRRPSMGERTVVHTISILPSPRRKSGTYV